ncbi:GNAT family N-acetyltransferase [Flavivirga algicola]|uniref:GNAT family N-acetyltransferase n=1 Tax=Flavivirga algicola TaxID=2729136 RepID=A0ABX1RSP1_9FLAO|nr:GNAT family N-acetyltransferase [Flavivirga algicola]NMH86566.1 GNAT family N-acetyltransferase [Flavivirga algicola]
MNSIKSNIENLTSLWQTVSQPFKAYFEEKGFEYSFVENSEWPNRLWFNKDIDEHLVSLVKNKVRSFSSNMIVPYCDIYKSDSFKLLEQNDFHLKFEQIGMTLKTNSLFKGVGDLKLLKVTTKKEFELWSTLFKRSFGYFINPELLKMSYKLVSYYIAYHQKEAVGTGILFNTGDVSGIHAVGIVPEQRRRGYAERTMKLLINEAITMNYKYVTLQASDMGKNLYLKLGFKEQFKIKNYILQK